MNIYNINSTYIMYGISYLLGYLFVLVFLDLVGYERIGSNHSGFAIHEFSFGLLLRVLPSAFSLPAFMYSA